MTILYLPAYFYPEKAASDYLSKDRNKAFAQAGMKTVAYAPTPCRGISSEERRQYCTRERRTETMYDGHLTVHRFPMFAEGSSNVMRALRYTLCWFVQLVYGLRTKHADCIFLASTPPIQGLLGAVLSRCKGVPFVYCLQDIFPDSLVSTGIARKGGLAWKVGRMIENATYRRAHKIIVISEDFRRNIMDKGVPGEKIEVVYNWLDDNVMRDIPRSQNVLVKRYGLDPEKFYITYCGNIGLTQNLEMLLDVAHSLKETTDIQFVLIGNGSYRQQLEQMVEAQQAGNVTLLPFQPYEDIAHVFSLGDASLVISKPGTGASSVPSKTWNIMAAAKPVLASFDEGELHSIIERNNCGLFIPAGDKEALRTAILRLYNDRQLAHEMGRNARQYVRQNLTKEVGTKRYVDIIKTIITNK